MQKIGWYAVLFVVFGIIPGWVFYKTSAVMSANAIDPAIPFQQNQDLNSTGINSTNEAQAKVPASYAVLTSITGSGGKLFEYYARDQKTKFSLLLSDITVSTTAAPKSPDDVLRALTTRQNQNFTDQPELAHFTQAYLGSVIDPQRAYDVSPLETKFPSIKFITNKGANYALSSWRVSSSGKPIEIALLATTKNQPVSAAGLNYFVETLKPELKPKL